jgi:hypothetical protein
VLRAAGASKVVLCVTHGIFSKGLAINGIDCVFCTDSYQATALLPLEIESAGFTHESKTSHAGDYLEVRRGEQIALMQMRNFVSTVLSLGA